MSAVLAHTSDTVTSQGWDDADRVMLQALRHGPTVDAFLKETDYPKAVARDTLLGYLQSGLAFVVVDNGYRYELTLAGRARLGQLSQQATVPALRHAA
jgi:hypothetical protein